MDYKEIFFVLPSLKTGGGNRVMLSLADLLNEKNNLNITVVCPNNSDQSNTFNLTGQVKVRIIGEYAKRVFGKVLNTIRLFRFLNRQARNGKTETIIVITDPIQCLLIPFLRKSTVIRYIQADDYRIFDDLSILKYKPVLSTYKYLCRLSYGYDCKYIYNSVYTYSTFTSVSKRKDVPLRLVHPAIDHSLFKVNRIMKGDDIGLNLAIVARKHPWKGFADFLRAWELISHQHKQLVGKVLVISHDSFERFTMPDTFKVIRPTSDIDIVNSLNEADIFISTSWWEGFGLPPLEAMACGCAVITSESGGVNEYAVNGRNCLMYKVKDAGDLARRIVQLLEDPALREQIALNAVKDSTAFSWEHSAEEFASVLISNA